MMENQKEKGSQCTKWKKEFLLARNLGGTRSGWGRGGGGGALLLVRLALGVLGR